MADLLKSQMMLQNEKQIILDIGMIHTKMGVSSNKVPFKIIDTPADIFLNKEFLKKDYFKLYNEYSENLELRVEEFFHDIFREELMESCEKLDVMVTINIYVPNHILLTIEKVLLEKFEVLHVFFLPSQFSPMYMSQSDSGIILDFGFNQFSFVPFYKGHILKQYLKTANKGGIWLLKRFYKSVVKINPDFEKLEFNLQIKMLNQFMVAFLKIPSKKEQQTILGNGMDVGMMRNKILKFVNEDQNLYLNYLENFRVSEYLFSGNQSIAFDFVIFLADIPQTLRNFLINNIIVVGGYCLLNQFFQRFQEEVKFFISENEFFKSKFNKNFQENFNFVHNLYPTNLSNWAGSLIFLKIAQTKPKKFEEYIKNSKKLFDYIQFNFYLQVLIKIKLCLKIQKLLSY